MTFGRQPYTTPKAVHRRKMHIRQRSLTSSWATPTRPKRTGVEPRSRSSIWATLLAVSCSAVPNTLARTTESEGVYEFPLPGSKSRRPRTGSAAPPRPTPFLAIFAPMVTWWLARSRSAATSAPGRSRWMGSTIGSRKTRRAKHPRSSLTAPDIACEMADFKWNEDDLPTCQDIDDIETGRRAMQSSVGSWGAFDELVPQWARRSRSFVPACTRPSILGGALAASRARPSVQSSTRTREG